MAKNKDKNALPLKQMDSSLVQSYGNAVKSDPATGAYGDPMGNAMDNISGMGQQLMGAAKKWNAKTADRRAGLNDMRKDFKGTRKDFKAGNKEEIQELKDSGATKEEIKAAKNENKQEQKDLKQSHKDDISAERDVYKQKEQEKIDAEALRQKQVAKSNQNLANGITDNEGSLNKGFLKAAEVIVKQMQQINNKAVEGDGDVNENMMNMNSLDAATQNQKETNKGVAELFTSGDMSNAAQSNPEVYDILNDYMNENTPRRAVKAEDGSWGYEFERNGEWMGNDDIEQMVADYGIDYTTQDAIVAAKDEFAKMASEDANGMGGGEPDMDKITSQVSKIVKTGNIRSMLHDDMLGGGGSFAEHLAEHPDMKNLGADLRTMDVDIPLEEGEEHWSDNLSEKDMKMLNDAITNPDNPSYNEDMTKGLMTSYLTQHLSDSYKKSYSKVADKDEAKETQPTESNVQYQQNTDGSYSPVSPKQDKYKDMTTEELLAMYPPKK